MNKDKYVETDGFGEEVVEPTATETTYTQPNVGDGNNTGSVHGTVRGSVRTRSRGATDIIGGGVGVGSIIAELGNKELEARHKKNPNKYLSRLIYIDTTTTIEKDGRPYRLTYELVCCVMKVGDNALVIPMLLEDQSVSGRPILTAHQWVANMLEERELLKQQGNGFYNQPKPTIRKNDLPIQTRNAGSDIIVTAVVKRTLGVSKVSIFPYNVLPNHVIADITPELQTLPNDILSTILKNDDGLDVIKERLFNGDYGASIYSYVNTPLTAVFSSNTDMKTNLFGQTILYDGKVMAKEQLGTVIRYNENSNPVDVVDTHLLCNPTIYTYMDMNGNPVSRVRPDVILKDMEFADGASMTDVLLAIYLTVGTLSDNRKVLDLYSNKPNMKLRQVGAMNAFCGITNKKGEIANMDIFDSSIKSKEEVMLILNKLFTLPPRQVVTKGSPYPQTVPEEFLRPALSLEIRESDSITSRIMSTWLYLLSGDATKVQQAVTDMNNYLYAFSYNDKTNTGVRTNLTKDDIISGYTINPVGYIRTDKDTVIDIAEINTAYLCNVGRLKEASDWYIAELTYNPNIMDIKMEIINSLFPNAVVTDRAIRVSLNPVFISKIIEIVESGLSNGVKISLPPVTTQQVGTQYDMHHLPRNFGGSIPVVQTATGVQNISAGYFNSNNGYDVII